MQHHGVKLFYHKIGYNRQKVVYININHAHLELISEYRLVLPNQCQYMVIYVNLPNQLEIQPNGSQSQPIHRALERYNCITYRYIPLRCNYNIRVRLHTYHCR